MLGDFMNFQMAIPLSLLALFAFGCVSQADGIDNASEIGSERPEFVNAEYTELDEIEIHIDDPDYKTEKWKGRSFAQDGWGADNRLSLAIYELALHSREGVRRAITHLTDKSMNIRFPVIEVAYVVLNISRDCPLNAEASEISKLQRKYLNALEQASDEEVTEGIERLRKSQFMLHG